MEAPAGLMPMKLLVVLGRTNMSMPMPLVRSLNPLSLPIRMAVMERIMMTSMAMATQLMRERRGRWTRLPRTNLFMQVLVYGKGSTFLGLALVPSANVGEVKCQREQYLSRFYRLRARPIAAQ